jgi:hypothetical protein
MLIPQELLAYQELTSQNLGFTPKLLGYKTTTQDKTGLVPGGFVIWLVWEMVPGLRLGSKDIFGSHAFWDLDDGEREEIRQHFERNLQ